MEIRQCFKKYSIITIFGNIWVSLGENKTLSSGRKTLVYPI